LAGKQKIYDESMRLAANFSWDKDWPNAVKAYRAALQEFPQDVGAMIGLGTAYFELEQVESAIRAFQRVLKIDAGNQDALQKMGEILERVGRLGEAAKTYVYAGNLYAKKNQLAEAAESWERAIKANPDQLQARNNLAHAYSRLGKTDLAISELIALGAHFQDQNQAEKAERYLEGALRLDAHNALARASFEALKAGLPIRDVQLEMDKPEAEPKPEVGGGEFFDDEDFFSFENLEDDSDAPANPHEQAEQLVLEELASVPFEDAAQYQGLPLKKPKLDLLIGQAIDWQTRGNFTQALEAYHSLEKAGFKPAAIHFLLATLYMKTGEFDRAIDHFKQARQEPAYLMGINFALGECYRQQTDAVHALRHYVQVLKVIDLNNARQEGTGELNQLYQKLVNTYVEAGDEKKTLSFVNSLSNFLSTKDFESKIIEAKRRLGGENGASVSAWVEFLEAPNTEVILAAMSSTAEYIQQNMLMTAAETCFKAIQQAPFYLPLHLRLAEVLMKQEYLEEAIRKYLTVAEVYRVRDNIQQEIGIYHKVLKVAPMDVTVRNKLIELYSAQNDVEATLEQYQMLADSYYQLAQINQALETYQNALKLAPKSHRAKQWQVNILHHLGDIYNQRVNWPKAAEVYRQLVKLAPDDDKARLALVDLYFKLGHSDNAIAVLDNVITSYTRQQKTKKLVGIVRDMAQLKPNELLLQERLAALYHQLGMKKEAINQYDYLGQLQLEAGLRDDAARTIQRIIAIGPDDDSGYKQLLAQIKGGL